MWLLVEPNSVVRTVEFTGSVKSVPHNYNKGPEFKSSFYFAFFCCFYLTNKKDIVESK